MKSDRTDTLKSLGSVAKAKDAINAKVKAVLQDKKNLNDILELQQNLEIDGNQLSKVELARATSSLRGLVDIMKHLIEQGDLDQGQETDTESAGKMRKWIRNRLDVLWEKILELLGSEAAWSLSEFALLSAFKIIRALHQRQAVKRTGKRSDHWSGEEVKLLRSMLPVLCSASKCCQRKIKRFQEYVEYVDVKQHVIQGLAKFVRQLVKKNSDAKVVSQHLKNNLMSMLEIIRFSKPSEKELSSLKTFLCHDDSSESSHFQFVYEPLQKAFSDLWECFLKMQLDTPLYKRVLLILNEQVMPHLSRPLLLTDFLINSYSVGGAISVLALDGVFTLIQKYHLEYPDFYTKLYALFEPEILAAKFRARFFYQANIFLTSSHLPEYLVAAFAKRLSRLALTAPADSLQMVFAFIGNLLLRHPGLLKMVHGKDEAADPYDMHEPEPSKSRAIDSCLWEVLTLQNHVLPQVAQSAKFISKKLPEMEWDLSEFLELDMADMMKVEMRKKAFVNVPLNFQRPEGMKFPKNDLTSKYFSTA